MAKEEKQCSISWYHSDHDWSDNDGQYHCPGVWPHPLPGKS